MLPPRTRIYRPETLNPRIKLPRALLTIEIKRYITLPCCSHSQQPCRHGQVDPRLARVGEYAALLAARLEERGVGVGGEDQDGFEGVQGYEGAEDGWRGHFGLDAVS